MSKIKMKISKKAIDQGNVTLLNKGLETEDVNSVDENGNSLLIYAIIKGSLKCIELLLSYSNLNLDAKNNKNMTAFGTARLMNLKKVMEKMQGSNAVDSKGNQLEESIITCDEENVHELLKESSWKSSVEGLTPLHIAAMHANPAIIGMLVKARPYDVNQLNSREESALYLACVENKLANMQALLEGGVKETIINYRVGKAKTTVLHLAAKFEHVEMIKVLTQAGADNRPNKDRNTALHIAAIHGKTAAVVQLLKTFPRDVNEKNANGVTSLYIASEFGKLEVVQCLREACANINLCDDATLFSPLMIAAKNGHVAVVKYLLENEADINLHAEDGSTALIIAVRYGRLEVVVELLARTDLKLMLYDNYKRNALFAAVASNSSVILDLLLQDRRLSKKDVNTKDQDGRTPFWWACSYGYPAMAELLLQYGADRNSCDRAGVSCIDVAREYSHASIVSLLEKDKLDGVMIEKPWSESFNGVVTNQDKSSAPVDFAVSHPFDFTREHAELVVYYLQNNIRDIFERIQPAVEEVLLKKTFYDCLFKQKIIKMSYDDYLDYPCWRAGFLTNLSVCSTYIRYAICDMRVDPVSTHPVFLDLLALRPSEEEMFEDLCQKDRKSVSALNAMGSYASRHNGILAVSSKAFGL